MMSKLTPQEVFDAVLRERAHQIEKFGDQKQQSLPGFLIIMRKELDEAELGWTKSIEGNHSPLNEIVQVVATGFACLEKYGVTGSAIATDDIPEEHNGA